MAADIETEKCTSHKGYNRHASLVPHILNKCLKKNSELFRSANEQRFIDQWSKV